MSNTIEKRLKRLQDKVDTEGTPLDNKNKMLIHQYDQLYTDCNICRKPMENKKYPLYNRQHIAVGLICKNCNTGVECFNNDLDLVKNLIAGMTYKIKK